MSEESVCAFEDCDEAAVTRVRHVLGTDWYCLNHGRFVRMVETDWERGEADMLEQDGVC